MLSLLALPVFAENFIEESEKKRPIMVVGSYLGGNWFIHLPKNSSSNSTINNSWTCNIPSIIAGYGDVFADHFYWGIEGEWGYGINRNKDNTGTLERARFHMGLFGHLGFYVTPSARLYAIIGTDKTNYSREKDVTELGKTVTKTTAEAKGFTWSFGSGILLTLSSRFGLGVEGRYAAPKSWKLADPTDKTNIRLSAWQMGVKAIIYI